MPKNIHPDLAAIQHWMQSLIAHPVGIEAGLSASGQENSQSQTTRLDEIINPSLQMTSNERLAIYANAYHARLIECLSTDFPVFRQTVGDEAFISFAVNYLHHHPSTSYTLGDLGAHFSDFLTATRPAASSSLCLQDSQAAGADDSSEPNSSLSWPDFLVELARLERALSEVFDGFGLERQSSLSTADLAAIDPSDWPQLCLAVAPCVRLLAFNFPVNDFYTAQKIGVQKKGVQKNTAHKNTAHKNTAHKNGEASTPPSPQKTWLAITRRNYIVRRYDLTESQFILLSSLALGEPLGEAISQAAESYPADLAHLTADLQPWFQTWSAAPMFAAISNER
jgi:hypothetical protein